MALRSYKFLFKAHIGKLTLNTSVQCDMIATWKRSNESAKTEPVSLTNGTAEFNQTLTLPVNMYFDSNVNAFQEKKSQFSFTLHTPKGDKSAGIVIVDLSIMLNNKQASMEEYYRLDKCPDKEATVWIKITSEPLGQMSNNLDQRSTVQNKIDSSTSIGLSQSILPTQETSLRLLQERVRRLESQNAALKSDLMSKSKPQVDAQSKKQVQKLSSQISSLKSEMIKSKSIQSKLQNQIIELKKERQQQQQQLQSTRKRLADVYQQLQETVYKYL